jgi:CubicO group peptidase (beta-lactamase class C family)
MNGTSMVETVGALLSLGDDGRHPASAFAGYRRGEESEVEVGGWARRPSSTAAGSLMTASTPVDLASVTKVLSATLLALKLVDEGLLDIEEQVRHHLPAFAGDGRDEVTVEHLLTHTGGLQSWWPLYCETEDRAAAVARAGRLPLVASPGSSWRYSDLGFILVGEILESITSLPLEVAFRQLIADPLGLSAGYGPEAAEDAAVSADSDAYEFTMVATGDPYPVPFTAEDFTGWRDSELAGVVNDGNAAHALGGVSGHAGLFAPPDDLLAVGHALATDGFVRHEVLERFSRPSPIHSDQAVGFRRARLDAGPDGGGTFLWHSGFTGTFFGFSPGGELVVAGGAMRLSGTLGGLPDPTAPSGLGGIVPGTAITELLLDRARALQHPSSRRL